MFLALTPSHLQLLVQRRSGDDPKSWINRRCHGKLGAAGYDDRLIVGQHHHSFRGRRDISLHLPPYLTRRQFNYNPLSFTSKSTLDSAGCIRTTEVAIRGTCIAGD